MKILQGKTVFDNWKIAEIIGEGDFGSVYKLIKKENGTEYTSALRVMSLPRSSDEINSLKSLGFTDEDIYKFYSDKAETIEHGIELIEKLKGLDNIVSCEEHTVIKNDTELHWDIMMRMELLTPLEELIRTKGIMLSEVLKLGIDICHALEICEQNGIENSDISPAHIFVSSNGDYKLGDLGMSKLAGIRAGDLTENGTQLYTAPEVIAGTGHTIRSDIYSIGIILYKLLNNNTPPFAEFFSGTPDEKIICDELMKGRKLPPPANASPSQKRIILKACAFKPENRYATLYELRMDIAGEFSDFKDRSVYVPPTHTSPLHTPPRSNTQKNPAQNNMPPIQPPPNNNARRNISSTNIPPLHNTQNATAQNNTQRSIPQSPPLQNISDKNNSMFNNILDAKRNAYINNYVEISRTENSITLQSKKTYSFAVLLLLTFVLGWFGIHRFYEKKVVSGLLYLFSFGLIYLGNIYDIIEEIVSFATHKVPSKYHLYKVITVTPDPKKKNVPKVTVTATRG